MRRRREQTGRRIIASHRLVVGLGNPGSQYARTRHNIGFLVVDELARRYGVELGKTKNSIRQALVRERNVILAQPQSYMNESGPPTRTIAAWHHIPPEQILAIVDDLDLPFGTLRLRANGSSGGHNGLRSLITQFGEGFPRLRVGIGRSVHGETIGHVLGTWSDVEIRALPAILEAATDTVERFLDRSLQEAANYSNSWKLPITNA